MDENTPISHIPVLQEEVLCILAPQSGETVIDTTVGLGGHARAFLERIGPTGHLIGIDADEQNLREAERRLAPWKDQITLLHGNFRTIRTLLNPLNLLLPLHPRPVNILFADLGLSSPHIDDPRRGFTFRNNAPLDLRFDRTHGSPASTILREIGEKDLEEIFTMYGELPRSHLLASLLTSAPPTTTTELKILVERVYKWQTPRFLPQVFQALRIAINDELGALADLLRDGPELLAPCGRMGILCYHSLEDRMVKQKFRRPSSTFYLLTPKVIRPTPDECARNPRARSARFRAIERAAPFSHSS